MTHKALQSAVSGINFAQTTQIVLEMADEKCAVDIDFVRQRFISLVHHEPVWAVVHHGQQFVAVAAYHLAVAPVAMPDVSKGGNLYVTQV